ncbi:MAG: hypothetical protein PVH73_08880 [Candidatus Bathyarchaeota archaeon]|jgi:hypothetical protein
MKIGEKIFPGSIVALLLGIFLAAPLLYTNVVIEPVAAGSEQLLDVELTYAYIEQNNTDPEVPFVNYFVASNITRLSEDFDSCDAKLFVYRVKFYSDNGFTLNMGMYENIVYNSDLLHLPESENETSESLIYNPIHLFHAVVNADFFNESQPIVAGGGTSGIWIVGESLTHGMSGVHHVLDASFEDVETMSVQVSLLGWVALNGNSTDTVILEEPKVVTEAQLEKFGDGFLYNTLIPEDELSDFDPINPYGKLFEIKGDSD